MPIISIRYVELIICSTSEMLFVSLSSDFDCIKQSRLKKNAAHAIRWGPVGKYWETEKWKLHKKKFQTKFHVLSTSTISLFYCTSQHSAQNLSHFSRQMERLNFFDRVWVLLGSHSMYELAEMTCGTFAISWAYHFLSFVSLFPLCIFVRAYHINLV